MEQNSNQDNFFNKNVQLEFLERFDQVGLLSNFQPAPTYIALKELETNKQYLCSDFRFIVSNGSVCCAVTLNTELWIILPKRFNAVITNDNHTSMLNSLPYMMKYLGKDSKKSDEHILEFFVPKEIDLPSSPLELELGFDVAGSIM